MKYTPITIDNYVALHVQNNPTVQAPELRKKVLAALQDFKNGIKCQCGNDIWVIASASVGNSCFNCIIGESAPSTHLEIEDAINKNQNRRLGRHIDDIPPMEISGYFDDDGYELNIDLIKMPAKCLMCKHYANPKQEILCNLTRFDQTEGEEFRCFDFRKID
jgi:hypothetical protein